ncbi:hypothetical protein [Lonepinella sp. BR2271]|uniref:hypothetical protein n=1 Tax=Lonepinella sp. BR2271 TaxID=3434550 RepID=UPI003F6DE6B7
MKTNMVKMFSVEVQIQGNQIEHFFVPGDNIDDVAERLTKKGLIITEISEGNWSFVCLVEKEMPINQLVHSFVITNRETGDFMIDYSERVIENIELSIFDIVTEKGKAYLIKAPALYKTYGFCSGKSKVNRIVQSSPVLTTREGQSFVNVVYELGYTDLADWAKDYKYTNLEYKTRLYLMNNGWIEESMIK